MDDFEQLFSSVGCTGALCVQDASGAGEITVRGDEPMVAASVIKVLIAVEAERRFADQAVDPRQRVRLPAARRTPGPVGFSLYDDDVEMSARDLVVAMMTISDNVATDALLDLISVEACNKTAIELGLRNTVLTGALHDTIDSIAQAAGFSTWSELVATAGRLSPPEMATVAAAVGGSAAMTPQTGIRTTATDMCALLRAIWADLAAPPEGCRRIRHLMDLQLTRDRLAASFPPPARVAAKSGGLAGLVRNEVGVVEYPDGSRYFAAVFTRRIEETASPAEINAVIGRVAARAVDQLNRS